jgi:putative Mg2+ transporter-C (MgtC) family protein
MTWLADAQTLDLLRHLGVAVAAGGAIGLERSFHGRPAGFRTHTLVCLASSLLMLVTIYQDEWFPGPSLDTVRIDPTRMAQGVMTGIGFLGAGVILHEGASVRGLTTAASIWITAAIGILAGVGLYDAVAVSTVLALGVLSGFRWIEARMPSQLHAHHAVRFRREATPDAATLRTLITSHGFSIANLSFRLTDEGRCFEYRMVIRSLHRAAPEQLARALARMDGVVEFRLSPTGD